MDDFFGFVKEQGPLVIFAVVFAEQIGLPLPAIPILIAAGALAGNGGGDVVTVGIAASAAALAADWIWYDLGRRRGNRVLEIMCRMALEPRSCIMRAEQVFKDHGVKTLVAAKFIPGLSTIAPPLAGIAGLAAGSFLLFDGLGIVLWVGSSVGLGYAFSDRLDAAMEYAAFMTPAALFGVAVMFSLYVAAKAWRRREELRDVPRVGPDELRATLEHAESLARPVLVDVRSQALAAQDGGIPGAVVLPREHFLRRYRELPRDREIVLYCACPGDVSSADAARYLLKKGWRRVRVLRGGIEAWRMMQRRDQDRATIGKPVSVLGEQGPGIVRAAETPLSGVEACAEPADPIVWKEQLVQTPYVHEAEEVVC